MIWGIIGTGAAGVIVWLIYMARLANAKHEITKQKNRAEKAETELKETQERLAEAEKKIADNKARNDKLLVDHQKDVEELQGMLNECKTPDVVVARLNRLGKKVNVLADD